MTAASAATPNPQRHQFPPDTCMDVDDGYVCKERKGHAGQHVGASDTTVHCWEPRVDPVREQLVRALKVVTAKHFESCNCVINDDMREPCDCGVDAVRAALKLAETQKEETDVD